MTILLSAARELASRAATAAELAMNRLDEFDVNEDHYVDPAIVAKAYAEGVEDAMRWIANDAKPTEALVLVLRSGRLPGDDLPVDHHSEGYPGVTGKGY